MIEATRHHARLDQPRDDGTTAREHLQAAAARGNASAQADLDAHPYPELLLYLVGWAQELVGRSGVGMSGLAPLSYREVEAWSRLTGHRPSAGEVEALMALDSVLRHPEPPKTAQVPRG